MTTDPTTLQTALEALVGLVDCYGLDHYGGDWGCAECHPDSDMLVGGFQCGLHLARAVLATPAPAADEARCIPGYRVTFAEFDRACQYLRDEGGWSGIVPMDEAIRAMAEPAPTPAPPTPPATEPVAALVERFLSEYGYAPRGPERVRLDAIVAAARAEGLDAEALAEALRECGFHVYGMSPILDAYNAARARRAGEGGS